jgi:hypothetical protein
MLTEKEEKQVEEAPLMTLEDRRNIYLTMNSTCMVNIWGHGDIEIFDDLLQKYSQIYIPFKALLFSPIEQCLLNTSTKKKDQCTSSYSRWGKMKEFLSIFKTNQESSSHNIINNFNIGTAGMQDYYVKTYPPNMSTLQNSKNDTIRMQSQGHFKPRTPVNQNITFDCISSISYVNYCKSLNTAEYTCLKNEFSGLILPLIKINETLYTTGHHTNSIKMINPLFLPRDFVDFSLFCDICTIQNMTQSYFNMIKQLLIIRQNIGYNIVIQKIKNFVVDNPCVECDKNNISLAVVRVDQNSEYKIIKIDMETIMMLFVLFLLISNGMYTQLNDINDKMGEGIPEKKVFETINKYSFYPLDFLSHACRPGREEIERTITQLFQEGLYKENSSDDDDEDEDNDAMTVDGSEEDEMIQLIVPQIEPLLLRRSARVARRDRSYYTPQQNITEIARLLENKEASNIDIILRRSLRIAKQKIEEEELPASSNDTRVLNKKTKRGGTNSKKKRKSKRSKKQKITKKRKSKRSKKQKITKKKNQQKK